MMMMMSGISPFTSQSVDIVAVFSSNTSLLELPESAGGLLQTSNELLDVVKATVKQIL